MNRTTMNMQHVPRHSLATAGRTSNIQLPTVRSWTFLFLLLFSVPCPPSSVFAQAPLLINYQGRLLNGTNLVNGTVALSLRLHSTPAGGVALYEDSNSVVVADGLYATFLGDHPTNTAFLAALTNAELWVEVAVYGTTLAPRERVASTAYALSLRGLLVTPGGSFVFNPDVNALQASASNTTVGGGIWHVVGSNIAYSVISGGVSNRLAANASESALVGGAQNAIGSYAVNSFIGGGASNLIGGGAFLGVIGGGYLNFVGASEGVVVGGANNRILSGAGDAFVGGGSQNTVSNQATHAAIAGGYANGVGPNADYAFIGGGSGNRVGDKSYNAVIAGGLVHEVGTNSVWAAIGGGFSNVVAANSAACTIPGGRNNRIGQDAEYATVGGGLINVIEDLHSYALIAGGSSHLIASNGRAGVISGGLNNEIQALVTNGTIAGGADHVIATGAHHAVISGGWSNRVTGRYGTIPGGDQNLATNYAFAAGQRAKARHGGAYVWGDNTAADVASTNANSVTFRAAGGYRLFTDTNLALGAQLSPNATAWAALSDRRAKENFAPIDTAEILDRVAGLPLTAWTYTADPEHRRYIGPVAQDFHAAFGLGNDTTINTLDTDGVALAAIQALARENAEFRMSNAELRKDIEALKSRLRALEAR